MLVYRDAEERFRPREAWRRLHDAACTLAPADHDAVTALLIDAGEIEAAVTDAIFPDADGVNPVADELRSVTLAAARLFLASSSSSPVAPCAFVVRCAIDRFRVDGLPAVARRRVSEGFAFYALHPEAYVRGAREFADAVDPPAAVCLGLRSIGTTLAAVVAAALLDRGVPVSTFSVRPRGHPFDRRVVLDPALQTALRRQPPGAHYLVVDEGPGLSGSSFASAARALSELGIDDSWIQFFPSWNPDGAAFRSDAARDVWRRHRRWVSPADAVRRHRQADEYIDFSGGAWRPHLFSDESVWPAVQPQYERIKSLLPVGGEIVRFAGLGRYGAAALDRARALAAEDLGPEPCGLAGGYLRQPFVEGVPCTPSEATPELLERAAWHIGFLARTQRVERPCALEELQHLIQTNVSEADGALRVPPLDVHRHALAGAPVAAIDGRMLPHEWIRTRDGYVKTDALDHASDHFFPGPQDPAWDLAALETEFALGPGAVDALLTHYARASGDRDVRVRLPFYRIAYSAFQLGYATMACQSLGTSPDGRRFERRAVAFLDRLRTLLAG